MSRKPIAMVAFSIALAAMACSKSSPTADKSGAGGAPTTTEMKPTSVAAGGHAPAAVKVGAHEDWCGEHQVPESQCTRCNPEPA